MTSDRAQALARLNLCPLWRQVMRWTPGSAAVPAIWRWHEVYPELLRAARSVGTAQAERRVLHFRNPALADCNFIAPTLVAGLQILLPGETASAHRHSPNALRFVLRGEGAYTTVEGERVAMGPGDLVVTPAWRWHEHGNAGTQPVIWLDGLDAPLASLLGAWGFQAGPPQEPDGPAAAARAKADSRAMNAADRNAAPGRHAGTLRYPYGETLDALARLALQGDPDPAHGYRLRYVDPQTGGDPFATMTVFMQRLPAGFHAKRVRATDSAVYCVVQGRGRVEAEGADFTFGPNDTFVMPSWRLHRIAPESECVLFCFSDRAAQEALGMWREEG